MYSDVRLESVASKKERKKERLISIFVKCYRCCSLLCRIKDRIDDLWKWWWEHFCVGKERIARKPTRKEMIRSINGSDINEKIQPQFSNNLILMLYRVRDNLEVVTLHYSGIWKGSYSGPPRAGAALNRERLSRNSGRHLTPVRTSAASAAALKSCFSSPWFPYSSPRRRKKTRLSDSDH